MVQTSNPEYFSGDHGCVVRRQEVVSDDGTKMKSLRECGIVNDNVASHPFFSGNSKDR